MKTLTREEWGCNRRSVFRLHAVSDAHTGLKATDEARLARVTGEVADHPDTDRWIELGDKVDGVRPTDKRWQSSAVADWVSVEDIDNIVYAQCDRYLSYTHPIAAQCWAVGTGNHEQKCMERDGWSPHQHILVALARAAHRKPADIDADYMSLLLLKFFRAEEGGDRARCETVRIMTFHGARGNKVLPAAAMWDMLGSYQVDLLLVGHSHREGYITRDVVGINATTGEREAHRRIAVSCGSYLTSHNPGGIATYGERAGYPPYCGGGTVIEIAPFASHFEERVRVIGSSYIGREFAD